MGCFIINVANCINRSVYDFFFYSSMAAGNIQILDIGCVEEMDSIFDSLLTRINRSGIDSSELGVVICVPRSINTAELARKSSLYYKIVVNYRLVRRLREHGIDLPVTVLFFDSVHNAKQYESFLYREKELEKSFTAEGQRGEQLFASKLEGDFESSVTSVDTAQFYCEVKSAAKHSVGNVPDGELVNSYLTACRRIADDFKIDTVSQKLDALTSAGFNGDMIVMIDYLICLSRPQEMHSYSVSQCSQETLRAHFAGREKIIEAYLGALKEYSSRLSATADSLPSVELRRSIDVRTEPELNEAPKLHKKFMEACDRCSGDLASSAFLSAKSADSGKASFLALQDAWHSLYPRLHEEIVRAEENTRLSARTDSDVVYSNMYEYERLGIGGEAEEYTDGSQKCAELSYRRAANAAELNCTHTIDLAHKREETHKALESADRSIGYILSYATMWSAKMLMTNAGALFVLLLVIYLCAQGYAVTSWIFYATLAVAAALLALSVPVTYFYLRGKIKKELDRLRQKVNDYFSLYSDLIAQFEQRAQTVCSMGNIAQQLRRVRENSATDAADNEKINFHKAAIAAHLECANMIIMAIDRRGVPVRARRIALDIHKAPLYSKFYAVEPEDEGWREAK